MFVCRACVRSLAGAGAAPIGLRLLTPLRRSTGPTSSRRTFTGTGIKLDVRSAIAEPTQHAPDEPSSSKAAPAPKRPGVDDGDDDLLPSHLQSKGDEYSKNKHEKKLKAAVRKRLELYPDPWHIAQQVSQALEKGAVVEALMMTRMASRNRKVEVSWNHLIDYQMKSQRLHAAVKLYNEMKKRAQIPNARTYTIIFRGCAESLHPKLAVAEATRIYNYMLRKGPVKPNTIHMNAVLEVCARAGDLESMFVVLETANDQLRSPDSVTYTIVLNALRHDAKRTEKSGLGLVDAEVKREMLKNIQTARKVWAQVVAQWKRAKLIIDEPLVCAMGRVLAEGDYKDNVSILALLEETMNIPRLDGPQAALPPPLESDGQAPDVTKMSPKARKSLAASKAGKHPLYAQPGNKSLSLALTALSNTRKTSHATQYWDYFTRVLGVRPDYENYVCYISALASGHASAQMAALLESMPADMVQHITFRRAFNACVKDNLNKNAFKNACRIFDVMIARQRYPDPLAMRLFLHAARANTRHFYDGLKQTAATPAAADQTKPDGTRSSLPPSSPPPSPFSSHPSSPAPPSASEAAAAAALAAAKEAHGRQLIAAVDRMWEPLLTLARQFSYPAEPDARSPEEELARKRGDMQEMMATARRMIAALDRVAADEGMCRGRDALRLVRTRRAILQRLVERFILKLYGRDPLPDEDRGNAIRENMEKVKEEEEEEQGEGRDEKSKGEKRAADEKRAAGADYDRPLSHFAL